MLSQRNRMVDEREWPGRFVNAIERRGLEMLARRLRNRIQRHADETMQAIPLEALEVDDVETREDGGRGETRRRRRLVCKAEWPMCTGCIELLVDWRWTQSACCCCRCGRECGCVQRSLRTARAYGKVQRASQRSRCNHHSPNTIVRKSEIRLFGCTSEVAPPLA